MSGYRRLELCWPSCRRSRRCTCRRQLLQVALLCLAEKRWGFKRNRSISDGSVLVHSIGYPRHNGRPDYQDRTGIFCIWSARRAPFSAVEPSADYEWRGGWVASVIMSALGGRQRW